MGMVPMILRMTTMVVAAIRVATDAMPMDTIDVKIMTGCTTGILTEKTTKFVE